MATLVSKEHSTKATSVDSHVSPSAMNDRQGVIMKWIKQLWCDVHLQSENRFKSAPRRKIGSQNCQEKAPRLGLQHLKYVNDLVGHQAWKL